MWLVSWSPIDMRVNQVGGGSSSSSLVRLVASNRLRFKNNNSLSLLYNARPNDDDSCWVVRQKCFTFFIAVIEWIGESWCLICRITNNDNWTTFRCKLWQSGEISFLVDNNYFLKYAGLFGWVGPLYLFVVQITFITYNYYVPCYFFKMNIYNLIQLFNLHCNKLPRKTFYQQNSMPSLKLSFTISQLIMNLFDIQKTLHTSRTLHKSKFPLIAIHCLIHFKWDYYIHFACSFTIYNDNDMCSCIIIPNRIWNSRTNSWLTKCIRIPKKR